jgi:hypothetical protein
LWAARRACWDHAARSVREGVVLYLGASEAPEHVRQDHRCCHEVLRHRELRRGCRDFSPFASPSVVLELRLNSGFATDAFHPCRRLLGSDGTAAATGAGPAHLCAAVVYSLERMYFQWILFSTNAHNYCVFVVYYILIVQGDRRSFRQPSLDSRRWWHLQRRSFR